MSKQRAKAYLQRPPVLAAHARWLQIDNQISFIQKGALKAMLDEKVCPCASHSMKTVSHASIMSERAVARFHNASALCQSSAGGSARQAGHAMPLGLSLA